MNEILLDNNIIKAMRELKRLSKKSIINKYHKVYAIKNKLILTDEKTMLVYIFDGELEDGIYDFDKKILKKVENLPDTNLPFNDVFKTKYTHFYELYMDSDYIHELFYYLVKENYIIPFTQLKVLKYLFDSNRDGFIFVKINKIETKPILISFMHGHDRVEYYIMPVHSLFNDGVELREIIKK